MPLVLGALELSDKLQTLGAYAGFAAILGLAVLSLLYFGQARELRRLREWAGRAPERAAELQERVQADAAAAAEAQKRVVAQPIRPAAAAPVTAAAAATTPGAPAPAVPAIPATNPGAPGALSVPPSTVAGATAAAGATTPGTPTPGAPPATPGTPPVPGTPPTAAPGTPPTAGPGTPAAATPGTPPTPPPGEAQPTVLGTTPPPRPTPSTPPPTGGGTGELTLPPSVAAGASTQESGETAVPLRRVSAASTVAPGSIRASGAGSGGGGPSDGRGGRGGPLAVIGGVVAVLLVGVLVATQLLGGDEEPAPPNRISTTAGASEDAGQLDTPRETTNTTTTPEISRGGITVAVLNGTLTTGLARGASTKIETAGYKIGKITNAADQSRQATTVQFVEGSRRAAEDVAKIIGVSAAAVSAMDQGTAVVAGEDATVVVTVGADQDQ